MTSGLHSISPRKGAGGPKESAVFQDNINSFWVKMQRWSLIFGYELETTSVGGGAEAGLSCDAATDASANPSELWSLSSHQNCPLPNLHALHALAGSVGRGGPGRLCLRAGHLPLKMLGQRCSQQLGDTLPWRDRGQLSFKFPPHHLQYSACPLWPLRVKVLKHIA